MADTVYTGTPLTRYLFGLEGAKTINVRHDSGQAWYVARDICNLLGITNPSHAVNGKRKKGPSLKASERDHMSIHIGNHGKNDMLMVNNGGLLKLIYLSKKPTALLIQERIAEIPESLKPPQWHKYLKWEE